MSKPIFVGLGGGRNVIIPVWSPIHRVVSVIVRYVLERSQKIG